MKKAIKKIIALGVGATMVGATLLGAMAYDLGDFPEPFLMNGEFDAYTVVGADADPADILGVSAVTGSLAGEAQVCVPGASSTVTIEGDSVRLKGTSKIYLTTNITETLKSGDLDILADGNVNENEGLTENDIEYTQQLQIAPSGDMYVNYRADTEDDDSLAGMYLKIADSQNLYTYTVNFKNPWIYTSTAASVPADFRNAEISLLGTTYMISSVTYDSSNTVLTNIKMLSGSHSATQEEYTTETYTVEGVDYEVEVVAVTATDGAKLSINGETTKALTAGQTDEVAGIKVGIKEIMENEGSEAAGGDLVSFYLGSREIELVDGSEVKVDGSNVDGSSVTITEASNQITSIAITAARDGDDIFLSEGNSIVDPVFGAFDITFAGLEEDSNTNVVDVTTSSSSGDVTFENSDGDEIKLKYKYSGGAIYWGESGATADAFLTSGETVQHGTTSPDATDHHFLVGRDSSYSAVHLFKVDKVTFTSNNITEVKVKDITSDISEDVSTSVTADGSCKATTLFGDYDINICMVNQSNRTYNVSNKGTPEGYILPMNTAFPLKNTATLNISEGSTSILNLTYDSDGSGTVMSNDVIIGINYGTGSETSTTAYIASPSTVLDDDDSKHKQAYTTWGTIAEYSTSSYDATITGPEERTEAIVYVSAGDTTTTTSGSEVCTAATIDWVAAGKLDTDLASYTSANLLVVGGPAVNRAAASLLGLTYPTYGVASGIPENGAMIKLITTGDYNAVVAAGWEAGNTRQATNVLANHGDYSTELAGKTEVTIGGEIGSTPVFDYVAPVEEVVEETTEETTTEE